MVSTLGTSAAPVAAAFAILDAGGSGSAVGLVSAASTLPAVLFFLVGGVVADRLPRHVVMVGANIVSALSQAVFAALVLTHSTELWELVLLSACNGLATAFYMPAAEGQLMSSVDRAYASQAFAVFRTGLNGAQVLGAALGGVLVSAIGAGWVLGVDSATFVVAAVLRLFMQAPGRVKKRTSMAYELKDGWDEFTSRRWLWTVVLQFAVVNALGVGAFGVLGAVAAKSGLGGARSWGFILSCDAVGMLLGGVLMVRLRPQRLLVGALGGALLMGAPLLALGAGLPLIVVCAGAVIGGVGVEMFGVNWITTLRQEIPRGKFSRIAAYEALGSFGLAPLGAMVAGPAADHVGAHISLVGAAVVMMVLTLSVLALPQIQAIRRAPAKEDEGMPG